MFEQAMLIAYNQIRDYEEGETLENLLKILF